MANPLQFKPPQVDPRTELNRRLDAAPAEHAEALLVVWDILQSAHDQGVLDAVHGAIVARDTIFGELATYAKLPEGAAAIRNFIVFTKIFGSLDPEALERIFAAVMCATEEHRREQEPPSLFQLMRRMSSEDSRRGLSFFSLMLTRFGESLK